MIHSQVSTVPRIREPAERDGRARRAPGGAVRTRQRIGPVGLIGARLVERRDDRDRAPERVLGGHHARRLVEVQLVAPDLIRVGDGARARLRQDVSEGGRDGGVEGVGCRGGSRPAGLGLVAAATGTQRLRGVVSAAVRVAVAVIVGAEVTVASRCVAVLVAVRVAVAVMVLVRGRPRVQRHRGRSWPYAWASA
jgi:hypothetical protein